MKKLSDLKKTIIFYRINVLLTGIMVASILLGLNWVRDMAIGLIVLSFALNVLLIKPTPERKPYAIGCIVFSLMLLLIETILALATALPDNITEILEFLELFSKLSSIFLMVGLPPRDFRNTDKKEGEGPDV